MPGRGLRHKDDFGRRVHSQGTVVECAVLPVSRCASVTAPWLHGAALCSTTLSRIAITRFSASVQRDGEGGADGSDAHGHRRDRNTTRTRGETSELTS